MNDTIYVLEEHEGMGEWTIVGFTYDGEVARKWEMEDYCHRNVIEPKEYK